jgi:hypothetical protein
MYVQNKNPELAYQTFFEHLGDLLVDEQGIFAAATVMEYLRNLALSSVAPEDLTALHESMLGLFEYTKDQPATRIIALQALHTMLLILLTSPFKGNEAIDYLLGILPILEVLPSNDTGLSPQLLEIRELFKGEEDICRVILNQSSVRAPQGVRFYLEQQTNPGTCGLHALRHYVGTQWISLAQLNIIKSQTSDSQAALVTAIANITQTLNSVEIPNVDALKQEILDKIFQLTSATAPSPELIVEIVSKTKEFVSSLTEDWGRDNWEKDVNAPKMESLINAARTIENDVLSVSDGGVDGGTLLTALRLLLDDSTEVTSCEELEKLGLDNKVNYEAIFKAMDTNFPSVDRAIILAGRHFVPIRKNAEGVWHIMDGMIGIVPRGCTESAWGNDGKTALNGIIYSTRENLGDYLISKLGPSL